MPDPVLFLVRHGQTDWNAERRLQGQADVPVNALGLAQARANGERLARLIGRAESFDFVASPMLRTRQTMETLRAAMGLDPLAYRTDERLKEVHFGDWQTFTFAEVDAAAPGSIARRDADKWNFVPPGQGAESYQALMQRVMPAIDAIRPPAVVVAHGGTVRSLFRARGGLSEREAANLDVPQDRILRIDGAELEWI